MDTMEKLSNTFDHIFVTVESYVGRYQEDIAKGAARIAANPGNLVAETRAMLVAYARLSVWSGIFGSLQHIKENNTAGDLRMKGVAELVTQTARVREIEDIQWTHSSNPIDNFADAEKRRARAVAYAFLVGHFPERR